MRAPRPQRFAVAVTVGCLGLAGCVPATSPAPPANSRPATTGPATVGPSDPEEYAGPRPMPAADGGPMLWPTTQQRNVLLEGGTTSQIRYGFVDVSGQLVVPPRYDFYQFCEDATGRAAFVVAASGEQHADLLDLSGKVVQELPTRNPVCAGDTHVVLRDAIDAEAGYLNAGLLDLRSGELVVPGQAGQDIEVIDSTTVNVSTADGEYLLDLATGRRTPHPGRLGWQAAGYGGDLLPATRGVPSEGEQDALMGYLDRNGGWAVEPTLTEASAFRQGYAVIEDRELFSFLDASLMQVGGSWDSIEPIETDHGRGWQLVGYLVQRDRLTGILGTDLGTVVAPADLAIDCNAATEGACTVLAPDGSARLALLPEGTVTDLPRGFGTVLNRSFAVAGAFEEYAPTDRVLNLATGRTFTLGEPSYCQAAGASYVACQPASEALPTAVFTADGDRTGYREITAVPDAGPASEVRYYWVRAGRYQGFVDGVGDWVYRESPYSYLED